MPTVANVKVTLDSNVDEILKEFEKRKEMSLEAIGLHGQTNAVMHITANGSVDTGKLRDSFKYKVVDSESAVYIGTDVYYGKFVELGHRQQPGRFVPKIKKRLVRDYVPPKPFLAPAINEHVDEYKELVENYMTGD